MWVIDTDSILKLYRTYGPAFFGTLWEELDVLIGKGQLWSTMVNFDEIENRAGEEFLAEWKTRHKEMFLEADEVVQSHVVDILSAFHDLIDADSDQEQADPYLIGLAMKLHAAVITEEEPLTAQAMKDPGRKSKMKIPNVCRHFGVESLNLVQFINSPDWRNL